MVKDIVKNIEILQQKSESFKFGEDDYLIQDMLDTAEQHKENCIGLACIQIGVPKKLILVKCGEKFVPFINPAIIGRSPEKYTTLESCLSLQGNRQVTRHRKIKVCYKTPNNRTKVENFSGLLAQIIQHECDHLNGILI